MDPSEAPERGGRGRKRLLALGLSVGISLLALELVVRWRFGTPMSERLPLLSVRANAARGWEMVPGEHYTYEHRVHVNALGLRGPELAPKVAGEVRVLFLGDSLTYGQGVADGETLPALLENELRQRRPESSWTVVNAGLRAYGTAQELGLLDELGERIAPDVVLLGWYWNDVRERPIAETYQAFLPRGEFVFDIGGPMEGWPALRWRALQVLRTSALAMWLHDLLSTKNEVYPPDEAARGFQLLGRLLEHFRERCGRLGAEPVVVVYPDAKRLVGGKNTVPYDEQVTALAAERALPVVELLPALTRLHEATGRLPILPFDGHYDASANRAMAAFLAERLLELGVLPASH